MNDKILKCSIYFIVFAILTRKVGLSQKVKGFWLAKEWSVKNFYVIKYRWNIVSLYFNIILILCLNHPVKRILSSVQIKIKYLSQSGKTNIFIKTDLILSVIILLYKWRAFNFAIYKCFYDFLKLKGMKLKKNVFLYSFN